MDSRISQNKRSVRSTLSDFSEWGQSSVPTSSGSVDALGVTYLQARDLTQLSHSEASRLLAVIGYGGGQNPSNLIAGLNLEVNLPHLIQPPVVEVWKSSAPVLRDQVQDIRLAFTEDVVFGCVEISETSRDALEDVTRAAYEQIFDYCTRSGYSHLLRMWNYFPSINVEHNGLERYKRFCVGRHQAFSEYYKEFTSILPAASAVGTHDGPFQVLFVAGKQPGRPFENPRQISAYEYPPTYGPKSPSFARAFLHPTVTGSQLFVAGTASIVGHATQHQGDPANQTLETLSNIDAVLDRVRNDSQESWGKVFSKGLLKVFVRHRKDLPAVRGVLESHEYGKASILYVSGEMCRNELLVEIEGMWNVTFLSHA